VLNGDAASVSYSVPTLTQLAEPEIICDPAEARITHSPRVHRFGGDEHRGDHRVLSHDVTDVPEGESERVWHIERPRRLDDGSHLSNLGQAKRREAGIVTGAL